MPVHCPRDSVIYYAAMCKKEEKKERKEENERKKNWGGGHKPTNYQKHWKMLWERCYLLAFWWINIDIGIDCKSLWVHPHNESPINIRTHSAGPASGSCKEGQSLASAANTDSCRALIENSFKGPIPSPQPSPASTARELHILPVLKQGLQEQMGHQKQPVAICDVTKWGILGCCWVAKRKKYQKGRMREHLRKNWVAWQCSSLENLL